MHNWLEHIQQLPAVKQAGFIQAQPLTQGSSNQNIKVTTQAGIWVVRFNNPKLGIELGVDRHQEARILDLIQDLPCAPQVISNQPDAGILITEFIEASALTPADLQYSNCQQQLAQALDSIHQLAYQHLPSRLDQRLQRYLQHIPNAPLELAQRLQDTIKQLDTLGFWAQCQCLYHSDLNPHNILGCSRPVLIDWEFAGQGHALLDWLIMEHEFQTDLSTYYPADTDSRWLHPLQSLVADLMQLWSHRLTIA